MISNIRRNFGQHLTSTEIFKEHILPKIKNKLYEHTWLDLFCGEGNLILPILDLIPETKRTEFFKEHIYLFDTNKEMIKKSRKNATSYRIPDSIAEKNIIQHDTLEKFPELLKKIKYPIYHITNPPYLYIGYIVKNKETQEYLKYFKGNKNGYQDLYQIAMINDLKNNIQNMIYIIPSNFLFSSSGTNKIRKAFLFKYNIKDAIMFEKKIFEFTGTNVSIFFFEKKQSKKEIITFKAQKIDKKGVLSSREYVLKPEFNYRAGTEFTELIETYKKKSPLKFYLSTKDIEENSGNLVLDVIDINNYDGYNYIKKTIKVNERLKSKILDNILFIRTVDTGTHKGRAGLYCIRDVFGADGILVSKAKYRTYPIQIFFKTKIEKETQLLLKDCFNFLLEYLREKTDSEFMTTYQYSRAKYARKYLGLKQVKKLVSMFPLEDKKKMLSLKKLSDEKNIKEFLQSLL